MHAALKAWLAEEGDRFEVPVDGFVVDILRGDTVIEIQTGSASGLTRKLHTLLKRHRVRLVLPVPAVRTIVRFDAASGECRTRTSPQHGTVVDVFREFVSLRALLGDPNLSIDVVLIHERELRTTAGKSRRRRGSHREERHLIQVVDSLSFRHPADYMAVVPADLEEPFTTAELAQSIGRPRGMAQKIAYVLRGMDVLTPMGKRGNSVLYRRNVGR
ncbi:MAG: hypothetical protein PHV11_01190 [Candidatus Bipolaricaulis sp.]|nr:hypothetical protein [Candidatus Bipolaricaulis sp.]MDD5219166.1 hypothetical protein [Candidatus Bipolaricaulis sp.]